MAYLGVGRGKLLLFGEHAAVYGYPAVGLSLETALRVQLQPGRRSGWKVEGVEAEDCGKILEVLDLLEEISSSGHGRGGGTIRVGSEIPRGLGFGSSAALCAALAAAVAAWRGEEDQRRIWEWAHQGEKLFHGTPSGIDTGLALLGGLYNFRPRPPELPVAESLKGVALHLVVGAVPRRENAAALIGDLRAKMLGGDENTKTAFERLGKLADEAGELLRGQRELKGQMSIPAILGGLARESQDYLSRLGLNTPELDRMLEQGMAVGALGGKLSGAGGGGAFYLIYPDPEAARSGASVLYALAQERRLATADTLFPLSWIPSPQSPTSPLSCSG
jgi:mevalonate kinase